MIELNIDETKNLLFVNLIGETSESDIVTGVGRAGELLPKLKNNFSMIMNLSEFKETSADQGALFNKIIKSMDDKVKISLVIRIVGESKSLIKNLCKMDKLFNMNNVKYVPTMEDAVKIIDGLEFEQKECD